MLKWFQSSGQRTGLMFAMTLVMVLLSGAARYQLDQGRETLLNYELGYLKGVGRSLADLQTQLVGLHRLLVEDGTDVSPQELAEARQKLEVFRSQLEQVMVSLRQLDEDADANTRARFQQPTLELESLLAAATPGQWSTEKAGILISRLQVLGAELTDTTLSRMIAHHESADSSVEQLSPWVTGLQILLPLMLLLTWLTTLSTAIQPTEAMARHLRESSSRRSLTLQMDPVAAQELGLMAPSFMQFLSRLSAYVISVARINQAIHQTTQELSKSSVVMLEGVKRQGSQAVQVVTSVTDIVDHLGEMNKQSVHAKERSEEAVRLARSGRDVMEQTVGSMSRASAGVDELARSIEVLARSTERIGEVLALIEDIADQTNLLALNASIEAARAGERGRGFAVVADEIRTLSEKISRSAQEISRILGQVQEGTGRAGDLVKGNSDHVERSFNAAREASTSLNRILGNAESIQISIEQLSEKSKDESTAVERVAAYLKGVSQSLDEVTQWAQRSIDASQQVNGRSAELQRLIDRVEYTQDPRGEALP